MTEKARGNTISRAFASSSAADASYRLAPTQKSPRLHQGRGGHPLGLPRGNRTLKTDQKPGELFWGSPALFNKTARFLNPINKWRFR